MDMGLYGPFVSLLGYCIGAVALGAVVLAFAVWAAGRWID